MKPPVVVVGGGIGGLCAALGLAAQGVEVLVLERAGGPGGKMRQVAVDGVAMDAGPTVFTMRWVFDELFHSLGATLEDHLRLRPLETLARHAWGAGEHLDLYADAARSADAVGRFAGVDAARGFREFCGRAEAIYRALEGPFLRGSRPTPLSLVGRAGFGGASELLRISPFSTLWSELGRYFPDARLRQLFARYATYCGSSPYMAPATLMLVAHVEQQGVWQVAGGMHGVARALARLAKARGVHLRYGAEVDRLLVRAGRVDAVRLRGGETIEAGAVVFNGDVAALAGGLLGPPVQGAVRATAPAQRSLSALTWNLHVTTRGFPLLHHSVFFSADYRAEFDDIADARLPAAPTVYVCAQDRGDEAAPPPTGAERLLCIVNAPATGDIRPFTFEELQRCETQTFRRLALCGLELQRSPETTVRTTPSDFAALFPGTGGALYGAASHGWRASFQRPGARSAVPGLYLAGGSTHPGPGVPMAALSGRQAAASLLADRARARGRPRRSTKPSAPTATLGGTSTR